MNNINDPFFGFLDDAVSRFVNDEPASAFVIDDKVNDDGDMAATIFVPHGSVNNESNLSNFLAIDNEKKAVMEEYPQLPLVMGVGPQFPLVMGVVPPAPVVMRVEPQLPGSSDNQNMIHEEVVENILENIMQPDRYEFCIEESDRPKNKPYEVQQNCIVAKRKQGIRIRVAGALDGHVVKFHMIFKDEANYQKPVLACRKHNCDGNSNEESTFYVVPKDPMMYNAVTYKLENGHPTAIITVPMLFKEFTFSPIFRCWNSCNNTYGNQQQMILRLCDANTGTVLHTKTFDIRVCENIGRDSQVYIKQKRKAPKRLRKNSLKKVTRPEIKNEVPSYEELEEARMAQPAATTSRFYMVELDDELYPVLEALLKVRGKTVIEIDPASVPNV